MIRRRALVLLLLLVAAPAAAQDVVRRVGRVTIRVDLSRAFPGGVAVVRLGGTRLGAAWALLDGRRAAFYSDRGVARALVPIAASAEPGAANLGIGLRSRGGEQRISVAVQIAARSFETRPVALTEAHRALLDSPDAQHDARRLLAQLRIESGQPVPGPLRPPVSGDGRGFGEPRAHTAGAAVESRTDGLTGEWHRGIDYSVPSGTTVKAPGAGTVLLAGPLTLSGDTVVIDHGQGVVSVLQHLSRVFVKAGDTITAGAEVGLSGDSGLTTEPMLEWRVYLHAVPVDPLVIAAILG